MANKRQKKKQQKQKELSVLQSIGIDRKQAKALPKYDYDSIVTRELKRQQRNAARRAEYQAKKEYISKNGLQGINPRQSWESINKAAAEKQVAAKREKARQARENRKERNRQLLEESGIPAEHFPKKWYEMGADRLQQFINDYEMIDGDVWLYIGWGDRSGSQSAWEFNRGYYMQVSYEEQREGIRQTAPMIGEVNSSGRAGQTVMAYGAESFVKGVMQTNEKLGYQTIFCGKQLSTHALQRYWLAALDLSPESNRQYICNQMNGYLSACGRKDLQIKIDFKK